MKTLATSKGLERYSRKISTMGRSLTDLQRQMGEATQESSETVHDNAPFDVLRTEVNVKGRILKTSKSAINDCIIKEYPTKLDSRIVQYGVGVLFDMNLEENDFKIVGFGDEDPENGRIFYKSPLAQKLMGHQEGDRFEVNINDNISQIKIKKIYIITDLE